MAFTKRIFLFLLTNILVILTINITLSLLGVPRYIYRYSGGTMNFQSLLIFCAVFGFSGAIISLLLSKFMAKMAYGIQIINDRGASGEQRWLLDTIYRLARNAGIRGMPEVGIYPSMEVNAFATGANRNSALVAVSQGLLNHMSREEIEGVLGHEITHVANGDMVTMTLIQGVVNTFTMFLSRVFAWTISSALRSGDRDESPVWIQFTLVIVFDIVFSILGSMVVAAFSRWREFRADAGSAKVAGRDKMISALQSLQRYHDAIEVEHRAYATLKINGLRRGGVVSLFATHPSLEDRIEALKRNR